MATLKQRNTVLNAMSFKYSEKEMKPILKSAKARGYLVSKSFTKEPYVTIRVINPANDDLILKAILVNGQYLVEINFEYMK